LQSKSWQSSLCGSLDRHATLRAARDDFKLYNLNAYLVIVFNVIKQGDGGAAYAAPPGDVVGKTKVYLFRYFGN